MPRYEVRRSIQINATADAVRALISDFRRWPDWSPWTIQEPDCALRYHGEAHAVGSRFEWDGERIGAGSIALVSATDTALQCDLNFTRPFKSQADVQFHIEPLGDTQCKVSWDMHSQMPFFLFFLIPNIRLYIGMDYERGLKMLKELAETGQVASAVGFQGEHALESVAYLGTEVELPLKAIPEAMAKHYPAIAALIDAEKLGVAGAPFCNNLEVDMKADRHRMVIGIPIESHAPRSVGAYATGVRPGYRCARFDHTGAYEHLGNAWATAMGWLKHTKRKAHAASVGIEVYLDDPASTPRDQLKTALYIPLKG
ncbi:MAG: SRPBCC family protein [Pseudomonadota bacterium]